MKTKREVFFIFCYARSGGTFFNRYLSSFKEIVVLSEAHPLNTYMRREKCASIAEQATKWYGIPVKSFSYEGQLIEIKEWCDRNDKTLVVRDWSYIDFTKSNLNNYNPLCQSTNYEILNRLFDVKSLCFIRNAIDVALSRKGPLKEFSEAYLSYCYFIKQNDVEVFKYENFCENFDEESRRIERFLCLDGGQRDKKSWLDIKNVVGDVEVSRGNRSKKIMSLKRKYATSFLRKKINSDVNIIKSNRLFGYLGGYDSKESESFNDYFFLKLKKLPNKIKQVLS